jgi:hypothetical protein
MLKLIACPHLLNGLDPEKETGTYEELKDEKLVRRMPTHIYVRTAAL